ncbi:uncharacterized protein [Drosophila kikkawai]|uniref:PPIase cyclophilin-type domain-containing protein n=1 Tax=Drosophila kikkawai TaxID=30033 RepID=A0A6P4I2S5_DROKI|nr:uncharacterized protein LOC108070773 [Drosophila kikkawai]KAH8301450.1 hypothetical protein KR059_003633 [Drosophila kikkawai]
MFIRGDATRGARDTGIIPQVPSSMTPYVAAVKRGPYTMTNPVYNNPNPHLVAFDGQVADTTQKHTFNINKQALMSNYRHHQRLIPVAIGKHSLSRSRSNLVTNEQRALYRQHRERMSQVKGKVNTYLPPPKIKIEGNGMELSYMEMLTALYKKSNNTLRTFTKSPERLAEGRWRNATVARNKEQRQLENNKKFHKGGELFDTMAAKSKKSEGSFTYEIPMHVLHRYENLMDQCDVGVLCKLLRPQIYLDIEVPDCRLQGRLCIQLFTEACPQVVLEFMRVCTRNCTQSIAFTRALSPIWLEGKIEMDSERNRGLTNIEHDFETLNHGVDAGILSFPSRYVRATACSAVNFTISFKPLSTLNGRRIAFGKVRKGMQFLSKIHDAIGHLASAHNKIFLTDCGIL